MKKGLTIIEMVVVISIMVLLSSAIILSSLRLSMGQVVEKQSALVSTVLNQARTLTLSSKGNTQYGVNFSTSSVTLFTGTSYSSSSPTNIIFPLDGRTSLSSALSGGATSTVFQRLSGKTLQNGTVTISVISDASTTRDIIIFGTGLVQIN